MRVTYVMHLGIEPTTLVSVALGTGVVIRFFLFLVTLRILLLHFCSYSIFHKFPLYGQLVAAYLTHYLLVEQYHQHIFGY